MRFKENVNLDVISAIAVILPFIDDVFWEVLGMECTVTSARDGRHKTKKHPNGEAVDLRVRDPKGAWSATKEQRQRLVERLREQIGSDYDVVLEEDPEDAHSHIHVEWDPK